MSTQYAGLQANITRAAAAPINISSSTNATPIAVTLASAHGLLSGARVFITQHLVNTNANGIHTITVTGANTFTLNGTTGNGVGGATGTANSLGFSPDSGAVPSDGDSESAASVDVKLEELSDKVAFISQRIGHHVLLHRAQFTQDNDTYATYWTSPNAVGVAANGTVITGIQLSPPEDLAAGDIVTVDADFMVDLNNAGLEWEWRYSEAAAAVARVVGTRKKMQNILGAQCFMPIHTSMIRTVVNPGIFSAVLYGTTLTIGNSCLAIGSLTVDLRVYRLTAT